MIPPPPPLKSVSSTDDTQEDRGGRGWERSESFDGENASSSISHSIISGTNLTKLQSLLESWDYWLSVSTPWLYSIPWKLNLMDFSKLCTQRGVGWEKRLRGRDGFHSWQRATLRRAKAAAFVRIQIPSKTVLWIRNDLFRIRILQKFFRIFFT